MLTPDTYTRRLLVSERHAQLRRSASRPSSMRPVLASLVALVAALGAAPVAEAAKQLEPAVVLPQAPVDCFKAHVDYRCS
jgi:hypothetical protein